MLKLKPNKKSVIEVIMFLLFGPKMDQKHPISNEFNKIIKKKFHMHYLLFLTF